MNNIERLRKSKGYTLEFLAHELGCSWASILNWEQGKSVPSAKYICKLADHFGVTADYVLGREENENS